MTYYKLAEENFKDIWITYINGRMYKVCGGLSRCFSTLMISASMANEQTHCVKNWHQKLSAFSAIKLGRGHTGHQGSTYGYANLRLQHSYIVMGSISYVLSNKWQVWTRLNIRYSGLCQINRISFKIHSFY